MTKVTLVLGTAREERNSEPVALYLKTLFEAHEDVELTYVDVREHVHAPVTIPPWGAGGTDEKATPWQEIASATDTFVFVLPEYNHGYPGEWKLLIDSLYKEYEGKLAYTVGVSTGIFGGARVIDHVKQVFVELKMIPKRTALYVGKVEEVFKEETPTDEGFIERAEKFVDAVSQKA